MGSDSISISEESYRVCVCVPNKEQSPPICACTFSSSTAPKDVTALKCIFLSCKRSGRDGSSSSSLYINTYIYIYKYVMLLWIVAAHPLIHSSFNGNGDAQLLLVSLQATLLIYLNTPSLCTVYVFLFYFMLTPKRCRLSTTSTSASTVYTL